MRWSTTELQLEFEVAAGFARIAELIEWSAPQTVPELELVSMTALAPERELVPQVFLRSLRVEVCLDVPFFAVAAMLVVVSVANPDVIAVGAPFAAVAVGAAVAVTAVAVAAPAVTAAAAAAEHALAVEAVAELAVGFAVVITAVFLVSAGVDFANVIGPSAVFHQLLFSGQPAESFVLEMEFVDVS